MTLPNIMLLLAAIFVALMAGLFFSYSCSVVLGLGRLNDAGYLGAMQSINRAIQNPVFFLVFFASLLTLPVSTFLHRGAADPFVFRLMLAATIIYFAGVFGTTAAGNIPLNEALDKINLATASPEALAAQRKLFEGPWNRLNLVRTAASFISLVLVLIAIIKNQTSNA